MNKNILLYLLLPIWGVMAVSCDNWLDIDQNTEKNETVMFDKYDGFKSALAGCYEDLSSTTLYGTNLTMTYVEAMGNMWFIESPNNLGGTKQTAYYFRIHNYSHSLTETAIKSIYSVFYNTILEANMIIRACGEKGNNIADPVSRAVVEGEAYAIRALCHLDVLRLFGQIPAGASIKVALPYSEVTDLTSRPAYYSFEQYVAKLESDFWKAESLLKDNDPVADYSYEEMNGVGSNNSYNYVEVEDEFLYNRQYRLNYWAVKALQARMYRYLGQGDKAHDIAMEVINATTTSGKPVVALSSMEDYGGTATHFASPSECLFSLYFDNLHDISVPLLRGGKPMSDKESSDETTQVNPDNDFCMTEPWIRDLFSGTNTATDIRSLKMWSSTATVQSLVYPTIRKYFVESGGIVPIVRLSEMYLIAVEGAKNVAEANSLYETYMESKGVALHDPFVTLDEVPAELEKEYRRELYAEGQMFYYYKRNKASKMWTGGTYEVVESDYILPLPNTESNPNK